MRYLLMFLLLCGCAKTASQTITESALQQVNNIEQAITAECKTTAVTSQINTLRDTIKSQLSACELEKQKITADKIRWETTAVLLMIIIAVYFGSKILQK